MSGTDDYSLPDAVEIDPNLAITPDMLFQWHSDAVQRAAISNHGSATWAAIEMALITSWSEGAREEGVALEMLRQLRVRGQMPRVVRVLVQMAIDAGVEAAARAMKTPQVALDQRIDKSEDQVRAD